MNMPLDQSARDQAAKDGAANNQAARSQTRRANSSLARAPGKRRGLSPRAIARRAQWILWSKRLLPAAALTLLTLTVMWPEFNRMAAASREAVRRMQSAERLGGEMIDAHYHGIDARGRAYTITATAGRQASPEQVNLANPKADTQLEGGSWAMVQADRGEYMQHAGRLDLAGSVLLYRDDGIFLRTATATLDLKTGFAASADPVSAEGPFGTLDATGFSLADKGAMVQFTGPARLILNAVHQ